MSLFIIPDLVADMWRRVKLAGTRSPLKCILSRVICFGILCIQLSLTDYYLITYNKHTIHWMAWAVPDLVVITVFVFTFIFGYRFFMNIKYYSGERNQSHTTILHTWFGVITWFVYSIMLSTKVGIAFNTFAFRLSDTTFLGLNTLKSTVALAGAVFVLLLATLHDANPGTQRKAYIDAIAGTVLFDVIDCVASLNVVTIRTSRAELAVAVQQTIIAVACINLILPTLHLLILAKTNYSRKKLCPRTITVYRVIHALLVNLPLLITRVFVWHGVSHGVSVFALKNVTVICVALHDLYETYHRIEHQARNGGNKMNQMDIDPEIYCIGLRY